MHNIIQNNVNTDCTPTHDKRATVYCSIQLRCVSEHDVIIIIITAVCWWSATAAIYVIRYRRYRRPWCTVSGPETFNFSALLLTKIRYSILLFRIYSKKKKKTFNSFYRLSARVPIKSTTLRHVFTHHTYIPTTVQAPVNHNSTRNHFCCSIIIVRETSVRTIVIIDSDRRAHCRIVRNEVLRRTTVGLLTIRQQVTPASEHTGNRNPGMEKKNRPTLVVVDST